MQYYCIIFSHSLAVTIASRVSVAGKCQSGNLSSDRILYCHDFISSVLQLQLSEWAKSYRVVLCQPNYQMSSVFSIASSPLDSKQFCIHFENYRSGNGRKAGSRVIKMLRCVVRGFNQLNIINAK